MVSSEAASQPASQPQDSQAIPSLTQSPQSTRGGLVYLSQEYFVPFFSSLYLSVSRLGALVNERATCRLFPS